MSMISQEVINDIRNNVDIVEVISSYIQLAPKGKNYFGVCPFHEDNHPSMSVSKEKQIYTCFSCGATGNVYKFIMDFENISFPEALKKCADKAGIHIDINSFSNDQSSKSNVLYDIYENSTKFYQNLIKTTDGKSAKDYLNKREISDDIIKEFRIGLSFKERDMLTKFLIKNKYNKQDLLKSGLILENNYGLNDIYYNRIMFPLEDLNGHVVGFSGRIYEGNDTSKYINTRETEIFKKGEILYNYSRAKDDARNKGYVIIMEGFMDVIRAYTIGVKNVVATMGTAVTSKQAMTIKKMAKEVILCFDGDKAGAKATMACSEELLKLGITPKIIRLEDNLDPDDYIRKFGKDRFLERIDNPINIMDFKLNHLKENKDINDSEGLATYVNQVINELAKVNDDVLREITLNKVSLESNLDINFLRERLYSLDKPVTQKVEVKVETKKMDKVQKAEMYLINYMLESKEVIRLYDKKVNHMPTEIYRKLAREISQYYHQYNEISVADFFSYIQDNEEYVKAINAIMAIELKEEYSLNEINDYIDVIRLDNVNNQIKRLQDKIKDSTSLSEQQQLLEQICKLKIDECS